MSSSTFAKSSSSASHQQQGVVVESHSVQSQFAALTRDRDRLRWEVEAAERQRRQQEGLVRELRDMQLSTSQKVQAAHAALGASQKKRALLQDERARLSQILAREREELQSSQANLQDLTEQQRCEKQAFLQNMEEWNEELERLLSQAEELEWKRLVCTETMDMVPGVDLEEAKQLWEEALEKKQHEENIYKALEEERNHWRARAQLESDLDWNELERAWEHEASNDITVNLFYGGSSPESAFEESPPNEAMPVM